ncbi:S8 family serine peptidase [Amycolatopsis sp. CA-230715]|uniref:S8 family serine peptidase n=1 Tax=Amycolatopsis sp. CA-230715 TaxID=2745196 RepID=UPI001C029707|nr:S8 family serine peptidase [Amycolatopsis sp. CA-230715]
MRRALTAAFVSVLLGGFPAVATASPSATCADPVGVYPGEVPWGQRLLDPARIWPLTTGAGQLVAVVGTGVDTRNAQFGRGQVVAARDIGDVGAEPGTDCDGRGTIAAGIVAAQANPATTFAGVAPGAKILPVRYPHAGGDGEPDRLAEAIKAAVAARAGVILVAVPVNSGSAALTGAVAEARERGSVVISPAAGTNGAPTYPAATPGALAVGSLDRAGATVGQEAGDHLGIAAPGADLVSTSAGGHGVVAHRWPLTDPGLAAAYVAGAAALVRAYHPALSPEQVVTRLVLTANRPPNGDHDPKRGWGTLDAYAAVTAQIPADAPAPGLGAGAGKPARVVPAAAAAVAPGDGLAGGVTIGALGFAAAAGIAVAAVRRGRARGWQPGRRMP